MGLVRTWKEIEPEKSTYQLIRAEVRNGENTERRQTSDRHLLPVEDRGKNW